MRPWIAVITFVAGGVLWFVTRRERGRGRLAPWVPRLGIAMVVLGLSTMAIELGGRAWNIVSIVLSLAAIGIFVTVIRDILRRR